MIGIPWATVVIVSLLLGVLILYFRLGQKQAVDDFKLREHGRLERINRMLAETERELDKLPADERSQRLRDKWSRD